MIRRDMRPEDLCKIKEIHAKYFSNLYFPDFFNKFLGAFVITNDEDKIIVAGGVRLIPEAVIFTEQDSTRREKYYSLLEALNISCFLTRDSGHNALHAFVFENPKYLSLLERFSFETYGTGLIKNL